ncbi:MAG: PAS domain S-box protein [Chthonomonadales bacterium]|nr:PAS domain S-box protein [Chthonomonadales bacterium]
MGMQTLTREIECSAGRLAALRRRAVASSDEPETLELAFTELDTTIEELRVANQELHARVEEPAQSRLPVEAERARYERLLEFAPDAYIVTDGAGVIREANRAAAALLSVDERRLLGKPLLVFVKPSERQSVRSLLAQAGRAGRREEATVRKRPRHSDRITASVSVDVPPRAPGGRTTLLWLLRDVTELRDTERRLREWNAELETRVRSRTRDLTAANDVLAELVAHEQLTQAQLVGTNDRLGQAMAETHHRVTNHLQTVAAPRSCASCCAPGRPRRLPRCIRANRAGRPAAARAS